MASDYFLYQQLFAAEKKKKKKILDIGLTNAQIKMGKPISTTASA